MLSFTIYDKYYTVLYVQSTVPLGCSTRMFFTIAGPWKTPRRLGAWSGSLASTDIIFFFVQLYFEVPVPTIDLIPEGSSYMYVVGVHSYMYSYTAIPYFFFFLFLFYILLY